VITVNIPFLADIALPDRLWLPLLIFFARVLDVSLGTLRIIFISRGKKYLAPALGFLEVFIWIVAVSQIMRGVQDWVSYLAYAAGFATGNYVGMWIENRLAIGTLIIRTILPNGADELVGRLRQAKYGVTSVQGQGSNGPVTLVYTIIKRKDMGAVVGIIHQLFPHAFLTVEELRSTAEGIFPPEQTMLQTMVKKK